jgi:uncharacterized protein (DUF2147 family)
MRAALLLVPALVLVAGAASAAPAPITGRWLTEGGKAIVEIAPCGPQLCGRILRIIKPTPGRPATDIQNPNAALRTRPLQGINILSEFKPGSDRWKGRIYDPESGKTYRSELLANGNALTVKGCIAFFCQSQSWTRAR